MVGQESGWGAARWCREGSRSWLTRVTFGEDAIPLAQMITALRQELEGAVLQGQGHPVQFLVGDIDLELNVGLTRQKGATGGVQFWVFTLGANASRSASTTHTIRLTLKAQTAAGADLRISGQSDQRPE
jgi:hypothetical protein